MSSKEEVLQEAVNAVELAGGNQVKAADALGIVRSTLQGRIRTAKLKGVKPTVSKPFENPELPQAKFDLKEAGDNLEVWSIGDSVRTVKDAIAKAEIDLKCWDVVEKTVNSWPTTMKITSKANGVQVEQSKQVWNWQVKLKLRRKAPKMIQDGIKELLKDLPKITLPKVKRTKPGKNHLLEISLYDAHFGKLCWGQETGTDYDLEIAESDFVLAVEELLELNMGCYVDRVVFPVGNDFFQVNNWAGTTQKGTRVESVDDRFSKVYVAGCRAMRHAILKAREVGTVDVIWVPGNHDPETSWYLCHYLGGIFERDKHVKVHFGPSKRKYVTYGRTLLGYAHGDEATLRDLPLIMATDEPELWAKCHCRAFRTGHLHTKKKFKLATVGDTFKGVQVDVLPSISGTDAWHYDHGFVGNARTAECWIWGKEYGYRGHQSVATRSQKHAYDNPVSRAIQVG